MKSICGVDCSKCYNKKCKGCKETNGCPFGKKCFIASYIEIGGKENYNIFKKQLIDEINSLNIEGMKKVEELYPLNGEVVNLEYLLPSGKNVKYLDDKEIYLGNQIECEYDNKRYFGVLGNTNFILVCEYNENKDNGEILIYKKR